MKVPNYQLANFLDSVYSLDKLPVDDGIEVAFAGRSNAGKSSALNTITRNKKLAHTSKTPGRTQCINIFTLDDHRRLVDLPGYGYAKVPKSIQKSWGILLSGYIESRQSLAGIVLLMDIRHPLTEIDRYMLNWTTRFHLPIHILLTKSDKLSRGVAKNSLLKIQKSLELYGEMVTVQLFSATKKIGVDEAIGKINEWYTA